MALSCALPVPALPAAPVVLAAPAPSCSTSTSVRRTVSAICCSCSLTCLPTTTSSTTRADFSTTASSAVSRSSMDLSSKLATSAALMGWSTGRRSMLMCSSRRVSDSWTGVSTTRWKMHTPPRCTWRLPTRSSSSTTGSTVPSARCREPCWPLRSPCGWLPGMPPCALPWPPILPCTLPAALCCDLPARLLVDVHRAVPLDDVGGPLDFLFAHGDQGQHVLAPRHQIGVAAALAVVDAEQVGKKVADARAEAGVVRRRSRSRTAGRAGAGGGRSAAAGGLVVADLRAGKTGGIQLVLGSLGVVAVVENGNQSVLHDVPPKNVGAAPVLTCVPPCPGPAPGGWSPLLSFLMSVRSLQSLHAVFPRPSRRARRSAPPPPVRISGGRFAGGGARCACG